MGSPAAQAATAPAAAKSSAAAAIFARFVPIMWQISPALAHRRRLYPHRLCAAQHRLADRARSRRRALDHADDRHDHQEVQEIVGGEHAGPYDISAFRRLGAE